MFFTKVSIHPKELLITSLTGKFPEVSNWCFGKDEVSLGLAEKFQRRFIIFPSVDVEISENKILSPEHNGEVKTLKLAFGKG